MNLYRAMFTDFVFSESETTIIKNSKIVTEEYLDSVIGRIENPSVIDILKCAKQFPGCGRKALAIAFYKNTHGNTTYKQSKKMVEKIIKDMKRFNK